MLKIFDKIKFEHIFLTLLLLVVTMALFKFSDNKDIIDKLIVALIATITAVTTYIFTKFKSD